MGIGSTQLHVIKWETQYGICCECDTRQLLLSWFYDKQSIWHNFMLIYSLKLAPSVHGIALFLFFYAYFNLWKSKQMLWTGVPHFGDWIAYLLFSNFCFGCLFFLRSETIWWTLQNHTKISNRNKMTLKICATQSKLLLYTLHVIV